MKVSQPNPFLALDFSAASHGVWPVFSSKPGLWLPWIIPDVLDADILFSKERRENRPSAHPSLSRELSHQYWTGIISVIFLWSLCYTEGKEEDGQSCPCPPQLCCHTQDCHLHRFCMGLCLPLEAALHVLQQAGWEPLHCCPEGLRLKRGPTLTVPLRPFLIQQFGIKGTFYSSSSFNQVKSFNQYLFTCSLTVISQGFFQWSQMGSWNSNVLSLNATFIAMYDKLSSFKLIWNAWRGWFTTA